MQRGDCETINRTLTDFAIDGSRDVTARSPAAN
jgi:hypothetical protein